MAGDGRSGTVQDFKKLRVWHESVELAVRLYRVTEALPDHERYGLRSQLRAAVISVSSNIAEGCGRPTRGDMARFLGFAIGSVSEIESQLYVAVRLRILNESSVADLLDRAGRLKRRLVTLYTRVAAKRGGYPEVIGTADQGTYHLPPTT